MADYLGSGDFRIVSLTQGHPAIGINYSKPISQDILVSGLVDQWIFTKVIDNKYQLSINRYPYAGVVNGKVIASLNPEDNKEWEIILRERQNAYTIALADNHNLGWTIVGENHEIQIGPIVPMPSLPQLFVPSQLFKLEESD